LIPGYFQLVLSTRFTSEMDYFPTSADRSYKE
jgi:hypothetical protein